MLDGVEGRLRRLADRAVARRRLEAAERIGAGLPQGIEAERVAGGVRLSGRGLKRRFALEPALRWLLMRLR